MYIIPIIIILLQIGFAFQLSNKNAVLKEKVAKREMTIEVKENEIVVLKNKIQWHEQRKDTIMKGILNIKNFEKLHEYVQFPVVEMENASGMLISRKCQNGCIIESHDYPNYDMALMASKFITDLGYKMEKEYCRDCHKNTTDEFKDHQESVEANRKK